MSLTLQPMTAPTLDQLEAMTPQDMFDHSTASLIEQGCTSRDRSCLPSPFDAVCLYDDKQGNRCAIGWLMPTELPKFLNFRGGVQELATALGCYEKGSLHRRLSTVLRLNADLLTNLQQAHDEASSSSISVTGDWAHNLQNQIENSHPEISFAVFTQITE
jgi:hypothetical protein